MQGRPDLFARSEQIVALRGDAFVETVRLQGREPAGIVGLAGHRADEFGAIIPARERHHELDIVHVLAVVIPKLIQHHVDKTRAGARGEFAECVKEFVVIGRTATVGTNERVEKALTS